MKSVHVRTQLHSEINCLSQDISRNRLWMHTVIKFRKPNTLSNSTSASCVYSPQWCTRLTLIDQVHCFQWNGLK